MHILCSFLPLVTEDHMPLDLGQLSKFIIKKLGAALHSGAMVYSAAFEKKLGIYWIFIIFEVSKISHLNPCQGWAHSSSGEDTSWEISVQVARATVERLWEHWGNTLRRSVQMMWLWPGTWSEHMKSNFLNMSYFLQWIFLCTRGLSSVLLSKVKLLFSKGIAAMKRDFLEF